MRTANTRYGTISVPNAENDLIGQFLFHYGEWAWLETAFIADQLAGSARVLDVGAFIGTFSLGLLGTGKLDFACCVEANPSSFEILCKNAETTAGKVLAVNAIVSDPNTALGVGHAQRDNAGSTSFSTEASGDLEIPPPEAVTSLGDLIASHGPFNLVKIDVEGMELDVIRSYNWSSHPDCLIWLECNENLQAINLLEFLLQAGQPCWYFAWPAHNPDNFKGQEADLLDIAYEAGLLVGRNDVTLGQQLLDAGCILLKIESTADLRRALWRTPRGGPIGWRELDRPSLIGIASHLSSHLDEEHFLSSGTHYTGSAWSFASTTAELQVQLDLERQRAKSLQDSLAQQVEVHLTKLAELGAQLEKQLTDRYTAEIDSQRLVINALRAQLARAGTRREGGLRSVVRRILGRIRQSN